MFLRFDRRRSGSLGVVWLTMWCVAIAPAGAQPVNDDCAAATAISGLGPFAFNNAEAVTDGPEHDGCLEFGSSHVERDVWYCWTAPVTGLCTLTTCALTAVDTKIAVYEGCACPPTDERLLGCNDDACVLQSEVVFPCIAGRFYLVRIGVFPGAPGGGGQFGVTVDPGLDCNSNGVDDVVDIDGATSVDCNADQVPDECELVDNDCNSNGTPDDCEDCNGNGRADDCEIAAGSSLDCNTNGVPDSCDVVTGTAADCNFNLVPDECELIDNDCNNNGLPDECEDCNGNGWADDCEIAAGSASDCNTDGVPDECGGNPLLESTKLTASDAANGGRFGFSVAIDGDLAIVGDYSQNVSGNAFAGAAYIFRRVDQVWLEVVRLTASDAAMFDQFGAAVSISGNTAVVGARLQDFAGGNSGSVYIFRDSGAGWQEIDQLVPDDPADGDFFGVSLAIDGDSIIVGSIFDDDAGQSSGSAYVFREVAGEWQQIAKLTASDAEQADQFGVAVALAGDTAVVGAEFDDDAGFNSGAAYVFRDIADQWLQVAKLTASDAVDFDEFGVAVSIDGDTVAVGAHAEDGAGEDSGAAYVFQESGEIWQEVAKLVAPDGAAADDFGAAVSVSGENVVVGARLHDANGLSDSGAAYLFRESVFSWQLAAKMTADDASEGDQFGFSVAADDGNILVGAWLDGDSPFELAAGYVFPLAPSSQIDDCNSNGVLDQCDLAAGTAMDCNANLVPDVCELIDNDCNSNGIPDDCEDCNGNGRADDCDLAAGSGVDCNTNGVPDECELTATDCNTNGIPDDCDLAAGSSVDCNTNGVPDECELTATDCNTNGIPDECDLAAGSSLDCNTNGVPDECDLIVVDCNTNGIVDNCEPDSDDDGVPDGCDACAGFDDTADEDSDDVPDGCDLCPGFNDTDDVDGDGTPDGCDDCNSNGIPDVLDVDCNDNLAPDDCDITAGTSDDCNTNGVPDECELSGGLTGKLTASDAATDDRFGFSVSIHNKTAVIGARGNNDAGSNSGSAYVFERIDGAWLQAAKLTAADASFRDNFGVSVSVSGDTVLVGAYLKNAPSNESGAAYVFRNIAGDWQQIARLTASDAQAQDYFGIGVSISGDTAVVGAVLSDDAGSMSGSAYVFREIGDNWQEIAKLTASDAEAADQFGIRVALSGDTAVIGAYREDHAGPDSGSAYVFRELNGVWQEIAKLTAADAAAGDEFGVMVSISGDTVIVGAHHDDDGGSDSGSAYVFRELDGSWQQIAKLTASDETPGDAFGYKVAISDRTAVVGAHYDDDAGGGSAYVFRKINGAWEEVQKLVADDGSIGDEFGVGVSVSGGTALIGARGNDDNGSSSGSAYTFDLIAANDCNTNGIPDECETTDADGDGILDACDRCPGFDDTVDSDFDTVPDGCDLCEGFDDAADSDHDGIPDGCEDCNSNGIPDIFEPNCNNNPYPDDCDIAAGTSVDEDTNGVPDECDFDCNSNGVTDEEDIDLGISVDCNDNGVPDDCEDGFGYCVPPSEVTCPYCDINCDGIVTGADILIILNTANFGSGTCDLANHRADVNRNGFVTGTDVLQCLGTACFGL